ncbi:MAG: thiol protease/hemagglutinin PrtT [Prevotella sp.]|jgi:hypothetical protein|nr:thiol protease/hemagglutinin PrtT [Prevotella sp.]
MKKILCLLLVSFVFAIYGYSKQRTEAEALALAKSFCNDVSTLRTGGSLSLAHAVSTDRSVLLSTNDNVCYYIFNKGSEGFVVVSGDDRAKDILGYSDGGAFNYATAPENFKYWLNFYAEEINYLLAQPEDNIALPEGYADDEISESATAYAAEVQPLLDAIKWGQGSPYNNLCPKTYNNKTTLTGCVATGMAQVMNYYSWPDKGVGSNSYVPDSVKQTVSVNFSQTTYDWANMTPTYNLLSTQAQKDAVATLMYHCGVAVNMNYDTSANGGSGASPVDMGKGMVKHFKYDGGMQLYSRDYYSATGWANMLKAELNAARPVLYCGTSETEGGHLFVCDGYDSNGRFHINWGWSGSSDGYFELSALRPSSLGLTAKGFNSKQAMTVGIQPQTVNPAISYVIYADSYNTPTNTTRAGKFKLSLYRCYNNGITDIPGLRIQVELRAENGASYLKIDGPYALSDNGSLSPEYGFGELAFEDLTVPNSVPNGKYRLYITFKASIQADYWAPRCLYNNPQYVNVEVTASALKFTPGATSLSSAETSATLIYPNPAVDVLFLQSANVVKAVRITDLSGKPVLLFRPNVSGEITLPVSTLSRGTYILQSVTDRGTKNDKFIKK